MPPKHLRKKPLYKEDNYMGLKNDDYQAINHLLDLYPDATCVNAVYENFNDLDDIMLQYGMEKFCHLLISAVYLAEHGANDDDIFYSLSIDFKDIDTGDYDYLFSKEDLELIKKDMEYIRPFLG